jgi:hypothetical protein
MFHGSCRKVSKVLSIALEPISKSAVHYLARKVSELIVATDPRYRRCIAVDDGLKVLQISEVEDGDIPPQAKRKKTHTGNNKPQTIPKPIHTLLSDREVGGEQECLFSHYQISFHGIGLWPTPFPVMHVIDPLWSSSSCWSLKNRYPGTLFTGK